MPIKTLAETIGEDKVAPLIEAFVKKQTLRQIARRGISPALSTVGKIAGLRNRHRLEIETLITAFLVGTQTEKADEASPPVFGKGDLFERDKIIAAALLEWNPDQSSFRTVYAFAAKRVNETRQSSSDPVISAGIIEQIIASGGGITKFLMLIRKMPEHEASAVAKKINGSK